VRWFAGRKWKNNNKWNTQPPQLLRDFYSKYIIYQCVGGAPPNAGWYCQI
jgi:hypothetical protein